MSKEAMKQWADDVSKAYDILAFGHTERAAEILAKTRNAMREALAEQPAPMIRGDIRDGLVDDEPAQQEPDYKALYEKAVQQYNELADLMAEKKEQQEPTCKQDLQVWVQRTGQFSWEPQDERFWTRMQPAHHTEQHLEMVANQPAQEPVAIEHCIWARNGNTPCPHTSPPAQRKPLTIREIGAVCGNFSNETIKVVRQIEAKHGITGEKK